MNRGAVTSTLVCAAFIYACAPRVGHVDGDTDGAPATRREVAPRSPADTGMIATLTHTPDGGGSSFELLVTNHGHGTEVRFPNGQTHDVVVFDHRDREVWRWSEGRYFTQTLQTKQLRTGGSLRYDAKWKDAQPGTYRVVATLKSDTHAQRVELQVDVGDNRKSKSENEE